MATHHSRSVRRGLTTSSRRARLTAPPQRQSIEGLMLLVGIIAVMWVIEVINSLSGDSLDRDGGLIPRDPGHLWAIFTSPFLHVSFQHLIDNTVPLVFMGVIIALRGAAKLLLVTVIIVIVGGIGTWLIAPSGTQTVGASGLVFGYATYLFTRGIFDRSILEILTGVVVGAVWGGALIASVVPHNGVSWQAHVCGAIGGVLAAWLLAGRRSQRRAGPSAGGGAGSGGAGSGGARRGTARHEGKDLHEALDRALA